MAQNQKSGLHAAGGEKRPVQWAAQFNRNAPAPSVKRQAGQPMTLGNAAAARVRLIVWCKDCRHQIEPDPVAMAERYGAATTVPEWRERLRCSQCGGRNIDMLVTGER